MRESRGRLIVLEGVDNVGKSTIAAQLAASLSRTKPAQVLAFPGNEPGTVGKWVYDLHHDQERQSINHTCLQILHIAAHIDCIETRIRPLIDAGTDVILDRYWWSTYVYGIVGGVEATRLDLMIELEQCAWGDYTPNCIALIRRREAEQLANVHLVQEYEGLLRRERTRGSVIEVWNETGVETAVASIIEAAISS